MRPLALLSPIEARFYIPEHVVRVFSADVKLFTNIWKFYNTFGITIEHFISNDIHVVYFRVCNKPAICFPCEVLFGRICKLRVLLDPFNYRPIRLLDGLIRRGDKRLWR